VSNKCLLKDPDRSGDSAYGDYDTLSRSRQPLIKPVCDCSLLLTKLLLKLMKQEIPQTASTLRLFLTVLRPRRDES
jgi:hypothetical protein